MTLDELLHLRDIAAKVVAMYGEAYLPVFEYMHKQVTERQQQSDLKSLALMLANRSNS